MVGGRIMAICRYGGEFVFSTTGSMSYTGGEAHAVDIAHDMMFDDLKAELTSVFNIEMSNVSVKYFLGDNRQTLITVSNDKDLHRMVEFSLNMNAITTEVYIINKVDNRTTRSTVADSGPSITPTAAAGSHVKRKRAQGTGLNTPNTGTNSVARQKRPALIGNVDNCSTGMYDSLPLMATGAGTEYEREHRLATAGNDDDRANWNITGDPSTALFASLDSPGEVRPLITNSLWDDVITGVGQEFDNVNEFRAQLCKYAISKGFLYKFNKNESSRVTAKCIDENCPWRLHASESARKQKFVIKKFIDMHTCGGINGKDGLRRGTRHWLSNILKEKLQSSPNCKPKEIVREIYEEYGVSLTYSQVWRTREIAQKELYNMLKETYSQLPWFCERILETNPGSVAMLSTSHDSRFRRFFVSFHASLHGFEHGCRPLLFLDRIPLKSNNQCKLLAAAAVDGNDGIFPVAFAVVEDENYESWLWFLAQLKYAITTSRTITFVSNRQKGLDEAVPKVFEDSYHSYCLCYLIEDLKAELRKGPWSQQVKDEMIDDFTRAAQACVMSDFNTAIEHIRNVSAEVADWIMASKPENWSDALFRGSRFEHLSCNIVDSFSNWIPMKCESSIVLIVDAIRGKLMEAIQARREASKAWTAMLTPAMETKLQKEMTKAAKLNVLCSSESLFEVRGNTIFVVNIATWDCTCCRWQISGLPCRHAVAALNRVNRSPYDYCLRYFRTECYRLTYSASIHPIPDLDSLDFNSGASLYPPPGRRQRAPGSRPRRKRFNPNKIVTVVRLCSRCKAAGHNKSTCEAIL